MGYQLYFRGGWDHQMSLCDVMNEPLVSILIPNYNHSRFLDQCIKSAIDQTYKNLEIIILDNASSDDSVKTAGKYMYDSRVSVNRNQFNIMNKNYRILSDVLSEGKYFILLCADDYLYPEFIAKAVEIMEKYPSVGYVHGEKDFILEDGTNIGWDPFYKCSFVAPGRNTMPIYMMTTVAHPAQAVIRREAFRSVRGYEKEIDHMNADRTLWFYLSYNYDAAYIREKMCGIRIGSQTETYITQRNFQHPILCHLTIMDFVKFAKEKNLPQVYERETIALSRLAKEFLGYAKGLIIDNDYYNAKRYMEYATVLCDGIENEKDYQNIMRMIESESKEEQFLRIEQSDIAKRKHNYNPPEGYEEILK